MYEAHSELCAWRFGANAECDCKLSETPDETAGEPVVRDPDAWRRVAEKGARWA